MNSPITDGSCFDPAPPAKSCRNRCGNLPWRLALCLGFALSLTAVASAAEEATESQVKAAYLYTFGKFVTWPQSSVPDDSPREICVLGKDPFGAVLDSTVAEESIGGKNNCRAETGQSAGSGSLQYFVRRLVRGRPTRRDPPNRATVC